MPQLIPFRAEILEADGTVVARRHHGWTPIAVELEPPCPDFGAVQVYPVVRQGSGIMKKQINRDEGAVSKRKSGSHYRIGGPGSHLLNQLGDGHAGKAMGTRYQVAPFPGHTKNSLYPIPFVMDFHDILPEADLAALGSHLAGHGFV